MEQEIIICNTTKQFNSARKLTVDYMDWLGEDLCYQGIEKEMESFHIMYNKPTGAFIYITIDGEIAGGVGVRKFLNDICEMKRLFVHKKFRGLDLGLLLCKNILHESKKLGYKKMYLDTLPSLKNATQLYKKIGFCETSKYYNNPDERVVYMEIEL